MSGIDSNADNWLPNFKLQVWLEFYILLFYLMAALTVLGIIKFNCLISVNDSDKAFIYAFIGGFLGGWSFVVKWFVRVSAKGRNDQYDYKWGSHKFFWRVLTPMYSSIVAFALYVMAISDFLPIINLESNSGKAAFGFAFLTGYFVDHLIGMLRDKLGLKDNIVSYQTGKN